MLLYKKIVLQFFSLFHICILIFYLSNDTLYGNDNNVTLKYKLYNLHDVKNVLNIDTPVRYTNTNFSIKYFLPKSFKLPFDIILNQSFFIEYNKNLLHLGNKSIQINDLFINYNMLFTNNGFSVKMMPWIKYNIYSQDILGFLNGIMTYKKSDSNLSFEFNKQSHYIKNDYLTNLIQNEYSYLLSYSYDTEFIQTKFNLMAIIISDNKNPYSQYANNILYYTIDNEWGITYSNHKLKLSALFGTTLPEDLPYYDWISIENNSNFRKLFFISKLVNGSIKYIFPVNNTLTFYGGFKYSKLGNTFVLNDYKKEKFDLLQLDYKTQAILNVRIIQYYVNLLFNLDYFDINIKLHDNRIHFSDNFTIYKNIFIPIKIISGNLAIKKFDYLSTVFRIKTKFSKIFEFISKIEFNIPYNLELKSINQQSDSSDDSTNNNVNNTVHAEKNLFEKIYEIPQITNVNISLNYYW